LKNIEYSPSFEKIWLEEAEIKGRISNRLFCIAFIICNPASAIAFYLSGDPFFYDLIKVHAVSGSVILFYLFLNYRKVITSQQLSFYAFATLIVCYSFLLSLPHLSYVQSCLNLTLAVIFAGLVLRWPSRYAIICSVLSMVLFPLSIYLSGQASLISFFEDGGIFVLVANFLFPLINYFSYQKSKREFYYRYSLEEKNEALEKQKAIAENATRAKSNFLSMMSHEIRTPLNGIVGMVHLMMQEEDNKVGNNELLKTLKFSTDHLMRLVNDVLDLNKINSNHVILDPQPFAAKPFFENLRKTFLPKASEKGIDLVFDIDPDLPVTLIADQVRLNQILTNLIHNAVKFTSEGFVRFVVKESGREGGQVCLHFEVIDTGIGIPLDEQGGLFEFFAQIKPKVQKENTGTGLGLAISKELLRLFSSDILLQSEEGKGSTFSFFISLSFSESEPEADLPLVAEVADLAPADPEVRVLVVDDNKTNVVFATMLLQRREILFDIATNGQEAYQLFRERRYDLILMDLLMPVMDGFASTALIRQINREIPIIALTASAFENEKERALASGFNGYLTKPFKPVDFYNYVLPFLAKEG
jgi:signal transduction histidine kinase/CheY-like chemotaxis protein